MSNTDGLSRLPVKDYITPLLCPEKEVLSISALALIPVTSKTVAFYSARDSVLSQVRKSISGRMSYRNNWVVFYRDHGWLSRQSFKILYWKSCIRVIWEFHGWSPLLVVIFSGLSLVQILNCVCGVVVCAKIVQICFRLVHYIHGNDQEGLGSDCPWIMPARSKASKWILVIVNAHSIYRSTYRL